MSTKTVIEKNNTTPNDKTNKNINNPIEHTNQSCDKNNNTQIDITNNIADYSAEINLKRKNRCHMCQKKLKLAEQSMGLCKCGGIYCPNHRYSFDHNCTYDFKSEGLKRLADDNPVVVKQKLQKI